jgi:hypothetical protein
VRLLKLWRRTTLIRLSRFRLAFAIGATVVLSAACGTSGPDGPRLSHEQFMTRMHAICRHANANVPPANFGDPASDKRLIAEARRELDELRSLNPPNSEEKRLSEAFDHWSSAIDDLEQMAHAAETQDPARGQEAFREAAAEVKAISRLIPDYPVGECLGQGIG